ncbi:MAG TPA: D-amino-acid transaminase [Bacilli bacterium]
MILYKNKLLPEHEVPVSYQDRGYNFGDGVYEVFRIYQGVLYGKQAHFRRLERSAAEIRLQLPYPIEEIDHKLEELVRLEQVSDGTLYMQITRGVAPRAHVFPLSAEPVLMAFCTKVERPLKLIHEGITAITLPDIRWLRCDIKSLNLLPNVMAKQQAAEQGAGEAIMHRDGIVTECSASNIMIVKNGVIYTHPINHLILPGITRAVVLKLASESSTPIREEAFSLEDLFAADEVFVTGTTMEVTPVVKVNQRIIGNGAVGPVTQRLQAAFERTIGR